MRNMGLCLNVRRDDRVDDVMPKIVIFVFRFDFPTKQKNSVRGKEYDDELHEEFVRFR